MTLITPYEVIKYGPVADTFPTKYVCDQIYVEESLLFHECLGEDLYEAMLADMNSMSGIDDYDIQKTYSIDDEVIYEGCVFVSLTDENNADPDNMNYWKVRDKFKNECFQTLWDNILGQLIAFSVSLASVRYATYQAGGHGIMEMIDDNAGSRTVHYKAFDGFERKLESDIVARKRIATRAITTNKDCFSNYALYQKTCEKECEPARGRRKIYFKY